MITITTENSVYTVSPTSDGVGYLITKTHENRRGYIDVGERFLANHWHIDREGYAHFDDMFTSKVQLVEDSRARTRMPEGA